MAGAPKILDINPATTLAFARPLRRHFVQPARSFGPDVAMGNLSTWWVYLIGPVAGAVIAVGVAQAQDEHGQTFPLR